MIMNKNLKTSVAAKAHSGDAMEARDHSKNGASPKSQTSRENVLMYK
jgi:hypothetical protein